MVNKLKNVLHPKLAIVKEEALLFFKQCFHKKKILIISDKGIRGLPISSRIQASFAVVVLTLLVWVSFSTGRYFAYEGMLSEKEKEIWSTTVDNENLQYQIADLHKNLTELGKYFDSIQRYDKMAKLTKGGSQAVASTGVVPAPATAAAPTLETPQHLLSNLRSKVRERIISLESIIGMTGLKLQEIAAHNGQIKQTLSANQSPLPPQGGPFIDASEAYGQEALQNNINYLIALEQAIQTLPLSLPMKHYFISSQFGNRVDPIRNQAAVHNGIDLVGPYSAAVYATAPGKVVYSGPHGAYGNLIEVDHGHGITTRYGHLDKIFVREGYIIKRGQHIGIQGNSGRSTGNHLHYEVRYHGKAFNPEKFLKAGSYVF